LVNPDGDSVISDVDFFWRVDDLFDAVQFQLYSSLMKNCLFSLN
jgi:hypothetical protein